jgi:hypothetical protein
MMISGDCQETL